MRVRTQTAKHTDDTDATLVEAARTGSIDAFEELYRRHADAAWRVAQAVGGNPHDAADAVSDAFMRVFAALPAGRLEEAGQFRSYLLATTRNAAIDSIRRRGRTRPTDTFAETVINTGPTEIVIDSEDTRIVAEAFRDLPERWRSVLWLTEVEGISTREVGARLGLSANGAAQLAVRARAGLRERFLQAHLRADVDRQCRFTVDRLGAYVAGKLAPRDLAKVDQHLAGCAACTDRKEQLEDVGSRLRAIVLPLPLLLGPQVLRSFKAAGIASSTPASAASSISWTGNLAAKAQKPLMAATSGIFALGVISATVLGGPNAPLRGTPPPAAIARDAQDAAPAPEVPAPTRTVAFSNASAAFEIPLDFDPADFTTDDETAAVAVPSSGTPDVAPEGGTTTGDPAPAPAPPTSNAEPEPLAAAVITLAVGPLGAGLSLGAGDGSCTGGAIYDQGEMGCAPEEPETVDDDTDDIEVSASLDGSELGPLDDTTVTVGLP